VRKRGGSNDPIAAFQRAERARRRSAAQKCSVCGEDRPEALLVKWKPVLCVQCLRKKRGLSPLDDHHPAGRNNNPTTIKVPANDQPAHLTLLQYEWWKTCTNPDRSRLLAAAAGIRGFCDTVQYLMDKLLIPAAVLLERLDAVLPTFHGDDYLVKLGLVETDNEEDGSP
jgi:hypothetical protein